MKAKAVRIERPYGRRPEMPIIASDQPVAVSNHRRPIPTVRVIAPAPSALTPITRNPGSPAGRIYPLRLRQQAISLPRLLAQPSHIRLRVRPTHAHHRVPIRLRKTRRPPTPTRAPLPFPTFIHMAGITRRTTRRRNETREFAPRHLVLPDRKRLRDLHMAHPRTHTEDPRRHHDHFRAFRAIAPQRPGCVLLRLLCRALDPFSSRRLDLALLFRQPPRVRRRTPSVPRRLPGRVIRPGRPRQGQRRNRGPDQTPRHEHPLRPANRRPHSMPCPREAASRLQPRAIAFGSPFENGTDSHAVGTPLPGRGRSRGAGGAACPWESRRPAGILSHRRIGILGGTPALPGERIAAGKMARRCSPSTTHRKAPCAAGPGGIEWTAAGRAVREAAMAGRIGSRAPARGGAR